MGGLDGVATLVHLARGGEIGESHQTPHTVLVTAPHRQVRRYGTVEQLDSARRASTRPVLLVPPLAVSTDCYDLSPGLSVVEHLLSTGRVPYVLDFGDMTRGDRHLGFADFFADIVPGAIAATLADFDGGRSTGEGVDLLSWSLGGTISFLTAAADPGLPVRSITAVGTPLDYDQVPPYPLVKTLMRPIGTKPVSLALRALGGIPAPLVRTAYRGTAWQRELKKPGYIIRNADDTEALTRMKAIDRFQETMPGYPGKASEQMWENFIMRGELARGVLTFDDVTVDLAKVSVPVQLFGSHRDAIVSWAAAHHGVDLFTGSPRVEFATVETSHLGLIAGSAAVEQTWPRIDEFLSSLN
ncbi:MULTISPECIES: alpha/beta hydrolase [Gordonia]|jgi:polyhydroxyalkanoate synthase|uniref:Hydrolase n=3 Tax=Gordonia alkanivorans TaxID=84096 RepID=W9DLI6_9ACTN|nr:MULTISPECIES: alpha/beta hydrolase [Gordonia]ETA08316.1 hydrolase [Gordonia alkanivorans CGMCC 6845]MDH3011327.1 alpha/beta hydrolase [Gordonia alkanivorans]MDH3015761.1 alpha/beta hydrolase [Gordonia alkanivorans]MDH3020785.1 alpha/beta hydrolase [Gordonia alkanivorans]MDH3024735.1 alpha/beta hydrolase [Gordonia alkanivorans]